MRENRKAIDWTPYLESACQKYAHWRELYTFTDAEGKKQRSPKDSFLLDLRVETVANERQQAGEREEKTERFAVLEGLRKYAPKHVLLVGRPGSGKSTALARLLWEEAKANLEPLPQPLSYKEREVRIPILVELRYYQTSIFDLILDFLQRHELPCDRDTLESILIQQSCLLLFDGINELPSEEARRDLQQFRQKYAKVPTIFTTRDIGLGGDLNLEKKLEMLPLTEPQMRKFVCTYLPEAGEQMLKKLGTRLKEFGQTPLLLWMLCSVFKSNGNQIPANLGLVFREFTKIYDSKLKHDVPTYKESREWWRELLQELAWKMTQGDSKTEIQVAINRREAEAIFREYLQGKVEFADNCAKQWLNDLLKHHLIQLESSDKIAFRHQLIQEYYTAEALSQQLPNLSDEALQWEYLNYLKWTEPVALMLGMLETQEQAIEIVKLALEVYWKLGARLAGAVKSEWQNAAANLVIKLNIHKMPKIWLLEQIKTDAAIQSLIDILEDCKQQDIRKLVTSALTNIISETAISRLLKLLDNPSAAVRRSVLSILIEIDSDEIIPGIIKASKDTDPMVRGHARYLLTEMGIDVETEPYEPEIVINYVFSNYDPYASDIKELAKQDSDFAISELIEALAHPNTYVRNEAFQGLIKTNKEFVILGLIKSFKNDEDVVINEPSNYLDRLDTFSKKIQILDSIQNKLKYYSPIPKLMNQEIYISYNWQEDSNEMANRLVAAFEAKGITIIRDKTHVNYKDSIRTFMQQLGQGKCVVVVISDKYLKSENCMFELVEIAKHGEFRKRIFPVVLKDSRFYKATERLEYVRYWEERIKELETAMKSGGLANLQGITDDLNLYQEIRNSIASLTDILRDMNTLTPDLHLESGFQEIIQAVETKLIEDNQKITPTPNTPTAQPSSSSPNVVQNFYGNVNGVAGNVQGNLQVN